eukprot:gene11504-biopygen4866
MSGGYAWHSHPKSYKSPAAQTSSGPVISFPPRVQRIMRRGDRNTPRCGAQRRGGQSHAPIPQPASGGRFPATGTQVPTIRGSNGHFDGIGGKIVH